LRVVHGATMNRGTTPPLLGHQTDTLRGHHR
jgi:hypothetical protein